MKKKVYEANEFSLARMIHWCATANCKCTFFVNQIVIRYRTLALVAHICHFQKKTTWSFVIIISCIFCFFRLSRHEAISFMWRKENERPITVWCVDRELEFKTKKNNRIEKAAAFIIIMIPTRNSFNWVIVNIRDQWKWCIYFAVNIHLWEFTRNY